MLLNVELNVGFSQLCQDSLGEEGVAGVPAHGGDGNERAFKVPAMPNLSALWISLPGVCSSAR